MKAAAEKVAAWDFGACCSSIPLESREESSRRRHLVSMAPCSVGPSFTGAALTSFTADRIIPCHGDVIETGGKKGTCRWPSFLLSAFMFGCIGI